jgi:beta-glucosidase/6-phospho-beta-glucosidase/beta-galactosidase
MDNISFAGKPFPLEEAEGEFRRLKETGKNSFTLTIAWKAIEHEGQGIYDEAYLAYLRKILLTADKEGVSVIIEPQHDPQNAPAWAEGQSGCADAFKHAQRRLKNCKAITSWGSLG